MPGPGPYYIMPGRRFPMQMRNGKLVPVLITQAQFEACCCKAKYKLIPCTEAGTACGYCSEVQTPKKYTLYLSGYELDAEDSGWNSICGVYDCGPSYVGDGTIPNTILLSQSDACVWTGVGGYHCHKSFYEGQCLTWQLQRVANAWNLICQPGDVEYWSGEQTPAVACNKQITINNTLEGGFINGGTALLVPGDQVTPGARCPGGNPIYTNTAELAASVGKVVLLDDYVCYLVTLNTDPNKSQGDVTISLIYNTCPECCADV